MANAPPPRERKRRKWDVTASQTASSGPAAASASSSPAAASVHLDAAAVVARINEELRAKGVLPAQEKPAPVKVEPPKEVAREITINDAPPAVRQQLTKRHCHEDIQRRTGTVLTVKGRYYPPGMPVVDNEKPLFLRITPALASGSTNEEQRKSVDSAAGEVQYILQGQPSRQAANRGPPEYQVPYAWARQADHVAVRPPYAAPPPHSYNAVPAPGQNAAVGNPPPSVSKVFVGFSPPATFNLRARLAGPSGSYLTHIESETGARVSLEGWDANTTSGSAGNGLHIFIQATTAQAAEDARQLAQNLIDTTCRAAAHEHPGQVHPDRNPTPEFHQHYGAPAEFLPHHPSSYSCKPRPTVSVPPVSFHRGPVQPRHPSNHHGRPMLQSAAAPLQQPCPQANLTTSGSSAETALHDNARSTSAALLQYAQKRRFSEGLMPTTSDDIETEEKSQRTPTSSMPPPPPRVTGLPQRTQPEGNSRHLPVRQSFDTGGDALPSLVDYDVDED